MHGEHAAAAGARVRHQSAGGSFERRAEPLDEHRPWTAAMPRPSPLCHWLACAAPSSMACPACPPASSCLSLAAAAQHHSMPSPLQPDPHRLLYPLQACRTARPAGCHAICWPPTARSCWATSSSARRPGSSTPMGTSSAGWRRSTCRRALPLCYARALWPAPEPPTRLWLSRPFPSAVYASWQGGGQARYPLAGAPACGAQTAVQLARRRL